jgi:hypothetical protein
MIRIRRRPRAPSHVRIARAIAYPDDDRATLEAGWPRSIAKRRSPQAAAAVRLPLNLVHRAAAAPMGGSSSHMVLVLLAAGAGGPSLAAVDAVDGGARDSHRTKRAQQGQKKGRGSIRQRDLES